MVKSAVKKTADEAKNKEVAKKETKKVAKKEAIKEAKVVSAVNPHITEKASFLSEKGAYVFKIAKNFNKIMVREAIKKQYNVNPVKVSIINTPAKTIVFKRRYAEKPGYKKAIVYLKKGEKISLA